MKALKNYYSAVVIALLLAFLNGCMALAFLPEAVMMGASAIGAIEVASVNAAVSPGITKEQLGQIKKVAFVFAEDKQMAGVPFAPGGLTDVMADNLTIEMMKLGYECIERQQLRKVLEEQGLQMSGAVDANNAIKAGKIVGVQAIITGTVQSSTSMSTGYMGIGGTKMTSLVQSATFKIIGVEKADTLMVVAINYKHGQKPNVAAESMAKIIKTKLEDPFGKVELRDKSDESSLISFREPPEIKALNECIKRANEFAKASQWDKAINEWQTCLKIKGDSAAVFYNIGVAYESKGDLVKAKENYQKAQELKPDEFYIKANSRIDQRLEDQKKLQVQLRKPVKPEQAPKAVPEAPKPTLPPAPVTPPPKPEAASPFPSILAPKEAQAAVAPPLSPPVTYLVTIKAANVRAEANAQSKIIIQLKKEEKVEKLGKSGNWFKIKLTSGETGWVFKDLVKEAE